MPAYAIMWLGLGAALSRAGLNVIDRYQAGHLRLPLAALTLQNNLLPALLSVAACCAWPASRVLLLAWLPDWRVMGFAGLVQLNAYAFTFAFRTLNVNQATVAAKCADFIIPFGVWLTTGVWNTGAYLFGALTALACLPLLGAAAGVGRRSDRWRAGLIVLLSLLLQASVAPRLLGPVRPAADVAACLAFATAVILWRTACTCLPVLPALRRGRGAGPFASGAMRAGRLAVLRAVLTLLTQASFALAVSSPLAVFAWPLLNMAGVFAMLLAGLCLKERHAARERCVMLAILVLTPVRWTTA